MRAFDSTEAIADSGSVCHIRPIGRLQRRLPLLLAILGFVISAVCVLWWWSVDRDYPAARPQCETHYRTCSPYTPRFDPCWQVSQGYYLFPANCGSFETPGIESQLNLRLAIVPFLVAGVIWLVAWAVRLVVRVLRRTIRLVRHGTTLQVGLARFWIAASAGWLIHAGYWIGAHCSSDFDGYLCTSGTFRIESAQWRASDLWGYILTTPLVLLLAAVAIYWVILGFRPRYDSRRARLSSAHPRDPDGAKPTA